MLRRAQKKLIDAGKLFGEKATGVMDGAGDKLKKWDEEFDITKKVQEKGKTLAALSEEIDKKYDLSGKVDSAKEAISKSFNDGKKHVVLGVEKTGLDKAGRATVDAYTRHISEPVIERIKKHGLDEKVRKGLRIFEDAYGRGRSTIKPYFPPVSATELLTNTRHELTYISACIMQISTGEANKVAGQFGAAVVAKFAGVATTGALLVMVSSFGTAGTGAAIASLSGAAASSATLAWVGGLLGGGMAAGAVLTGGASIVIGLGAYKALGSERRNFKSLTDTEQRIVQYCWMMIAIIDDWLAKKGNGFNGKVANNLLKNTLIPLHAMLIENQDAICNNLDAKNAGAYRQHVLPDFQRVVVEGFSHFSAASKAAESNRLEFFVGGVFYALLTRTAVDDSLESQLVLDALRRSDQSISNASEAELSSYLSGYESEQVKGIASNVKGIYHELLWTDRYNKTHTGTRAEMFPETNHAGADIQIKDVETGTVIDKFQLKATDSTAYVNDHLERYPEIEVLVTDETASRMGAESSGINNEEITETATQDINAVADNTISDRTLESAELATAIATGKGMIEMLQGKKDFPKAVADTGASVVVATSATAITAYLFS